MLFLLPFVFAAKLGLSIWQSYGVACGLLVLGFGLYRWLNHLF